MHWGEMAAFFHPFRFLSVLNVFNWPQFVTVKQRVLTHTLTHLLLWARPKARTTLRRFAINLSGALGPSLCLAILHLKRKVMTGQIGFKENTLKSAISSTVPYLRTPHLINPNSWLCLNWVSGELMYRPLPTPTVKVGWWAPRTVVHTLLVHFPGRCDHGESVAGVWDAEQPRWKVPSSAVLRLLRDLIRAPARGCEEMARGKTLNSCEVIVYLSVRRIAKVSSKNSKAHESVGKILSGLNYHLLVSFFCHDLFIGKWLVARLVLFSSVLP